MLSLFSRIAVTAESLVRSVACTVRVSSAGLSLLVVPASLLVTPLMVFPINRVMSLVVLTGIGIILVSLRPKTSATHPHIPSVLTFTKVLVWIAMAKFALTSF